jgi:3-oxoadipate enol-lactonase
MENLTPTHQQMTRGTTTLHYWLAGPTDRPLVVFTHGGGVDHRMFEEQLAAVAKEYRVLLWDVHGHGQSQPLGMGGVFSLRTIVEDLLAIVDLLGYQQACFVGQSVGGYISQEVAFLYPERVLALVVIGGYCLSMQIPQFLNQRMQRGSDNIPLSEFKQLIAAAAGIRPEVKAYAEEACAPIETWLAMRKAIPSFFREDENYRLPMPLLLTHGAQDALPEIREQASIWARHEPNCHYVVVPDAGHCVNQDNPEFFNQVLLAFLHQHIPPLPLNDSSKGSPSSLKEIHE